MYYLFYGFIWLLTLLPFRALYFIADFLYILIYHVAGYRRKVVRRNLVRSFPDKNTDEIVKIEKDFYRYFCDLSMETLKEIHASKSEMKKRMVFENLDLLMAERAKGQSVMLMSGHYCNWEWTSVICLYLPDDYKAYPVYQTLSNKHFDALMIKLRNRYGAVPVEKDDLVRTMLKHKQAGVSGIYGMIADQSPMKQNIRYRKQFLHQDTPVFLGTEQLAKKYKMPVYYLDIKRVKRGYYSANVVLISQNAANTGEYEITDKFMDLLENSINQRPEFWLWSHNRWKHSNTK